MYDGNNAQSKHDSDLTRGKLPYQTLEKIKLFRRLDPNIKNVTEFVLFQEQLFQRCHTFSTPTSQRDGQHYYITSTFFIQHSLAFLSLTSLHWVTHISRLMTEHWITAGQRQAVLLSKTLWLWIHMSRKSTRKEKHQRTLIRERQILRCWWIPILQPIRERFKS